jgi:signal transduction histidine kinase
MNMPAVQMSSISRRLTWMNLLVSASALLLASVGFLAYDQYTFRENLVRNLSAQAQIIGANSASALMFNDPAAAEHTLSALASFPQIRSAGIVTPDGRIFSRYSQHPEAHVLAVPSLPPGHDEEAIFSNDEVILVRSINFQGKTLGAVFIASGLSELSHRVSRYILISFGVLVVSLIAALLISTVYRRGVAQPIISLARTAQTVSEQKNYSLRVDPIPDRTEIGLLIRTFNEMLQQIEFRDQELRKAHGELEQRVQERTTQLVIANKELEAFSYSVSHDLRGPLETINGFVHLLQTKYGPTLDSDGREYLQYVRQAARRMSELIEDLLNLSRVTTTAMHRQKLDLSALARQTLQELQRRNPERHVETVIANSPAAEGDNRLLQIVVDNLLQNAWKYTSTREQARIEFGYEKRKSGPVYFVRDNGVGFDILHAETLFKPFQRLHSSSEFPGTGVGLATVQRIIQRHGGDIWADAKVGEGATFYFTIEPIRTTLPTPAAHTSTGTP